MNNADAQTLAPLFNHQVDAWSPFVDRFHGLILHVAKHTCESRGITPALDLLEDLVSEVFLQLLADDYQLLRSFKENSSLSVYLTVIARRIIVNHLLRRKGASDGTAAIAAVSPPAFKIAWDPQHLTADEYAHFVSLLGDVVRAQGGTGVELLRSHGYGVQVEERVGR
jgi:RNA polymerase sigma-70 factor (ECF subfamily)